MDIKSRNTNMEGVLISAVMLCLFCSCMIPKSIKKEVKVCYNPNSDYSNYVSVNRIFPLTFQRDANKSNNISEFKFSTHLIFFKDGLVVMNPVLWNKENNNDHNTEYLCSIFKTQNYSLKHFYKYGSWGVYNIQNDTITIQCFNNNCRFLLNDRYSVETYYFKIISKDSITCINNFSSTSLNANKSYPCEIKVNSGSAWIKREKWLYCNRK